MNKKIAICSAAMITLAWGGMLQAHHSGSMFDITTAEWLEGKVVAYEAVNPHATMVIEAVGDDGAVQRWTVEGPHLGRIGRMGMQPQVGDVIGVCGFFLKAELSIRSSTADPYGLTERFVHGHTLRMPDGHWELFGPYGNMAECIEASGTSIDAWVDFLDQADLSVRGLWCAHRSFAQRPRSSDLPAIDASMFDELNGRMADPCD
jgi:hypothetical protein